MKDGQSIQVIYLFLSLYALLYVFGILEHDHFIVYIGSNELVPIQVVHLAPFYMMTPMKPQAVPQWSQQPAMKEQAAMKDVSASPRRKIGVKEETYTKEGCLCHFS